MVVCLKGFSLVLQCDLNLVVLGFSSVYLGQLEEL